MSANQLNFENIINENKHKIYRICSIYAVSPVEPEDLFQEVIFQIWKSLPAFKGQASVDTWLYRIALNVCMRSKLKLDKNNRLTERFEAIHVSNLTEQIDEEEQAKFKFLKECISLLEETDSSIIVLYLDELSYKEISEITGLSENHVAVKMKRIRKKLFDCITPKIQQNA